MEDEIDIRHLIMVIYKRRKFIIGIVMAAIIASGIIATSMTPTYKATAQINLGKFSETTLTTPSSAKELIVSDGRLQNVINKLGLQKDYQTLTSLKGSIDISEVTGTSLLNITIKASDPVKAAKIANEVSNSFLRESLQSYNEELQQFQMELRNGEDLLKKLEVSLERNRDLISRVESRMSEPSLDEDLHKIALLALIHTEESQILELQKSQTKAKRELLNLEKPKVINNARVPDRPIKPNKLLIVFLAVFLGIVVGTSGAFVMEFFNNNPMSLTNVTINNNQ